MGAEEQADACTIHVSRPSHLLHTPIHLCKELAESTGSGWPRACTVSGWPAGR